MFVAYLLPVSDITQTEIGGIEFTSKKEEFCGRIILLDKSTKGSEWYLLVGTRSLLFHSSWLKCITEINNNTLKIRIVNETRTAYIDRIGYSKNEHLYDEETNTQIYASIDSSSRIEELIHDYKSGKYGVWCSSSAGFIKPKKCVNCEKEYLFFENKSRTYCNICYKKLINCDLCGESFFPKEDSLVVIKEKKYSLCGSCLSKVSNCFMCGKPLLENYKIENNDVCVECFKILEKNKKIVRCVTCCNYFFTKSTDLYKTRFDNIECNVCNFHRRTSSHQTEIKDYNYKPRALFYKLPEEKTNSLYFGIEIEIEVPTIEYRGIERCHELSKFFNYKINGKEDFVYTKFDRSIGKEGKNGFEIVTHPFTYNWLKREKGIEIFKDIFNFSRYNCESFKTNTCGMHIHMSKKAFSDLQLYKFLTLIYSNENFCIKISERNDKEKINRYSSFTPVKDIETLSRERTNERDSNSRHRAVNLSCAETVEVRIFRGTMEIDKFLKNIEFCKSLFDFTRTKASKNIHVGEYINFVLRNQGMYNNLYTFMKERSII
jgi:hypothetical protein